MMDWYLYGLLAVLLFVAAIWLLLPSRPADLAPRSPERGLSDFFPVHSRYFPQMRQLFSEEDAAFLKARGSPLLLRRWKADRRRAARIYLDCLWEDFAGLNRLARVLARNTTRLEPRQQAQVAWLNLRFQLTYRLAVAQLALGMPAGIELLRITRLLGSLSGRLEKTALALNT